jgi:hypothetical protein
MKYPGRWWWLEPGHEKARCKGQRKDPYMPGQCKMMAIHGGYCKIHQKNPRPRCPHCKRPMF